MYSLMCLSSLFPWKKPDNINGNLLGYKIQYEKTNESNSYQKTLGGPATSHELSSLAEATEYDVRVLVYNDKGNGPASNVTTVRTLVRKGEDKGQPQGKEGGQLGWATGCGYFELSALFLSCMVIFQYL